MSKMSEEQLDAAVEAITEEIIDSPAMSPSTASQQDSVDFLGEIINYCQNLRNTIKQEMDE